MQEDPFLPWPTFLATEGPAHQFLLLGCRSLNLHLMGLRATDLALPCINLAWALGWPSDPWIENSVSPGLFSL